MSSLFWELPGKRDLPDLCRGNEYDLSRTPPLQAPKPIEDLLTLTEEHLAEN